MNYQKFTKCVLAAVATVAIGMSGAAMADEPDELKGRTVKVVYEDLNVEKEPGAHALYRCYRASDGWFFLMKVPDLPIRFFSAPTCRYLACWRLFNHRPSSLRSFVLFRHLPARLNQRNASENRLIYIFRQSGSAPD